MPEETSVLTVIPVEEQIQQELVKHNVTEVAIAKLKEDYLPLKIRDINDKETYLIVKEARKNCKALRVMAKKICVAGRENANKISQAWIDKEKDITGRIGEVEDHLEKQEKDFEAQVAAEKERRKREQEEQFIMRNQVLSGMNVLYSDGFYYLGEVSFEMSLIRECDPEIWESDIFPKFQDEYQKVEAERIEAERIKQEREAEFKRQQEELERKQQELAEKEAALKAAQEEQERKEREEHDRKMAAAEAAFEAKMKSRMDQLSALGMRYNFSENSFLCQDVNVHNTEMTTMSDDEWTDLINRITPVIEKRKEESEQKRLAEIEAQKELERIKTLGKSRVELLKQYGVDAESQLTEESAGKMDDTGWEIIRAGWQDVYEKRQREKWEKEQEEKRKAEELKKQQEMEQAKDKEKWSEMLRQVNAIEVYEMKSSQYRAKATRFKEKLTELKAIFNG